LRCHLLIVNLLYKPTEIFLLVFDFTVTAGFLIKQTDIQIFTIDSACPENQKITDCFSGIN